MSNSWPAARHELNHIYLCCCGQLAPTLSDAGIFSRPMYCGVVGILTQGPSHPRFWYSVVVHHGILGAYVMTHLEAM